MSLVVIEVFLCSTILPAWATPLSQTNLSTLRAPTTIEASRDGGDKTLTAIRQDLTGSATEEGLRDPSRREFMLGLTAAGSLLAAACVGCVATTPITPFDYRPQATVYPSFGELLEGAKIEIAFDAIVRERKDDRGRFYRLTNGDELAAVKIWFQRPLTYLEDDFLQLDGEFVKGMEKIGIQLIYDEGQYSSIAWVHALPEGMPISEFKAPSGVESKQEISGVILHFGNKIPETGTVFSPLTFYFPIFTSTSFSGEKIGNAKEASFLLRNITLVRGDEPGGSKDGGTKLALAALTAATVLGNIAAPAIEMPALDSTQVVEYLEGVSRDGSRRRFPLANIAGRIALTGALLTTPVPLQAQGVFEHDYHYDIREIDTQIDPSIIAQLSQDAEKTLDALFTLEYLASTWGNAEAHEILTTLIPNRLISYADKGSPVAIFALDILAQYGNASAQEALEALDPRGFLRFIPTAKEVFALDILAHYGNVAAQEAFVTLDPSKIRSDALPGYTFRDWKLILGDRWSFIALNILAQYGNADAQEALGDFTGLYSVGRVGRIIVSKANFTDIFLLEYLVEAWRNTSARAALQTANLDHLVQSIVTKGRLKEFLALERIARYNPVARRELSNIIPSLSESASQGDSASFSSLTKLARYSLDAQRELKDLISKLTQFPLQGDVETFDALVYFENIWKDSMIGEILQGFNPIQIVEFAEQGGLAGISALMQLQSDWYNPLAGEALRTLNAGGIASYASQGSLRHFNVLAELAIDNSTTEQTMIKVVNDILSEKKSSHEVRRAAVDYLLSTDFSKLGLALSTKNATRYAVDYLFGDRLKQMSQQVLREEASNLALLVSTLLKDSSYTQQKEFQKRTHRRYKKNKDFYRYFMAALLAIYRSDFTYIKGKEVDKIIRKSNIPTRILESDLPPAEKMQRILDAYPTESKDGGTKRALAALTAATLLGSSAAGEYKQPTLDSAALAQYRQDQNRIETYSHDSGLSTFGSLMKARMVAEKPLIETAEGQVWEVMARVVHVGGTLDIDNKSVRIAVETVKAYLLDAQNGNYILPVYLGATADQEAKVAFVLVTPGAYEGLMSNDLLTAYAHAARLVIVGIQQAQGQETEARDGGGKDERVRSMGEEQVRNTAAVQRLRTYLKEHQQPTTWTRFAQQRIDALTSANRQLGERIRALDNDPHTSDDGGTKLALAAFTAATVLGTSSQDGGQRAVPQLRDLDRERILDHFVRETAGARDGGVKGIPATIDEQEIQRVVNMTDGEYTLYEGGKAALYLYLTGELYLAFAARGLVIANPETIQNETKARSILISSYLAAKHGLFELSLNVVATYLEALGLGTPHDQAVETHQNLS